jgi:hypothetical protein
MSTDQYEQDRENEAVGPDYPQTDEERFTALLEAEARRQAKAKLSAVLATLGGWRSLPQERC